jgi:protein gp37
MGENSNIEWTDNTGGPWLVCSEVSPGCVNCYARELMLRRLAPIVRKAYRAAGFKDWETRAVWGEKAPRVLTKGFWTDAVRFDRLAAKTGTRAKMFPSLIDWLDDMPAGIIDQEGNWLDRDEVLADLLKLIHDTPNLDWLLLTKRPGNFFDRLAAASNWCDLHDRIEIASWVNWWTDRVTGCPSDNVWIGTTVEDQARADERIPELLKIPARVRFLSCEPLLEAVDLKLSADDADSADGDSAQSAQSVDGIHWVIGGLESGAKKRWGAGLQGLRSLRDQCRAAGVPFFMKQVDKVQPIPSDLLIREFPNEQRMNDKLCREAGQEDAR